MGIADKPLFQLQWEVCGPLHCTDILRTAFEALVRGHQRLCLDGTCILHRPFQQQCKRFPNILSGCDTRDTVVFHSPFHSSLPNQLCMDGMRPADMAETLFSRKKETSVGLVLLMIFSFLTGEMHEGFSIPAGGALLYCLAMRRGRFTCKEWCLSLSFAAGALTSIFAPGNFWRMSQHRAVESSLLNTFEQLPALIWFPAVFLIIFLFHNKGHLKEFYLSHA